jgi:hypothetical protein
MRFTLLLLFILFFVTFLIQYPQITRPNLGFDSTSSANLIDWKPIENYQPPTIKPSDSYTVLFIGDSMTEALGHNFDELRKTLSIYYPKKEFGLFNYGYGSSNIFSVSKRLHESTQYNGITNPPALDRYSDIIIIESFAYNPPSEYSLDEGLVMQNKTLDKIVFDIVSTRPDTLIVFLATIAPSKTRFGLGVVSLSVEKRKEWAEERAAYLQNHITYARNHNIPLINVYEKSLDKNGEANLKYIDPNNYIHPSYQGVKLISEEIANFFYEKNIVPR